ncbi:hypothetical protein [uncultured Arthrobacter sp.]|uniref:hypothetical protein n=1 Tax=uncultured Arthrobacter sp. TaxID=114050 RepID=UPI002638DD76|nr:hypothetical protein [uncultured Arthrobacter sp.]
MNWIRANRLIAAGLGIAVVGLVLLVIAAVGQPAPAASFGWFAYAPAAVNPVVAPGPTAGELFGRSLAGVGLILIAGALGYLRARGRA